MPGMISESSLRRKCIAWHLCGASMLRKYNTWFDLQVFYVEEVYCLVGFQDPQVKKRILFSMISASSVVRNQTFEIRQIRKEANCK